MRRCAVVLAEAAASVLLLAGCDGLSSSAGGPASSGTSVASTSVTPVAVAPSPVTASSDAAPPVSAAPVDDTAAAVLAVLPVKGRAPKTGYARDRFGYAWTDDNAGPTGHNGCSTRDDVLAAQLQHVVMIDACRVASGDEVDPYTGANLYYVRDRSTVDIDHVVALADAWQKGAQTLSAARRVDLANDPLNLIAVSSSANRQKGDGDAATWLPKVKAFRCAYVARQIAVKHRYGLWVTAAERDAMRRVLSSCPQEQVPAAGVGRAAPAAPRPTAAPPTTSSAAPPPPARVAAPPPDNGNCTPGYSPCVPIASDVDCAGGSGNGPVYVQGPIRVTGDDPYRLDSDHDGIGCEN